MFLAKLRLMTAALFTIGALGFGAAWIGPPALAGKPAAPPVSGKPDSIQLSLEDLTRLGIQTAEVKARGDERRELLRLTGVVTYYPDRLVSVRSRCAGEVVEIGQTGAVQFFPPSMALIVRAPARIQAKENSGASSKPASNLGESLAAFRKIYDANASRNLRFGALESDVAALKERLAWAERMAKLGFLSTTQVQAERVRLQKAEMNPGTRQLRFGDKVQKGQVLAVLFSKDLGMKQIEFLDALARERLDRKQSEQLTELYNKGAVAESVFRAAEREAHTSANKVVTARRTLLLWKLTSAEIDALAEEVARAGDKRLGQIAVRAPMDGVVVESNVNVGQLVDPRAQLFRIADLSRLQVVVNASERELAALRALPAAERSWTIRPAGNPKAPVGRGRITHIPENAPPGERGDVDNTWQDLGFGARVVDFDGNLARHGQGSAGAVFADYDIDGRLDLFVSGTGGKHGPAGAVFADVDNDGYPDLFVSGPGETKRLYRNMGNGRFQHVTQDAGLASGSSHAPVIGWVDNQAGRLLPGQFINATVQLPAVRQEVAVPTSALVQEAGKEYVIVQPDPGKLQYTARRVLLIRRDRYVAHVRAQLTPAEMKQGFDTVHPGDRIITRGAVELKARLANQS